jgi:hypothetical protein
MLFKARGMDKMTATNIREQKGPRLSLKESQYENGLKEEQLEE